MTLPIKSTVLSAINVITSYSIHYTKLYEAMLLREETKCFCFLAGHESFAAAEGAIGIAKTANKVRKTPLNVILNGLGKDAAFIISRINGFTYVQTEFDYFTDA